MFIKASIVYKFILFFCRKCKLCSNGITMAAIDIMYIDITRRWTLDSHEGIGAGMCFGAFLEGFFSIATRKFRGSSLLEKVSALVEVCECNLKRAGARPTPRPHPRRLRRPEMVRRRVSGGWPTTEDWDNENEKSTPSKLSRGVWLKTDHDYWNEVWKHGGIVSVKELLSKFAI